MDLGMIGLGRMGANMTERLLKGGHRIVVYDLNREVIEEARRNGGQAAESAASMVKHLTPPRAIWLMVPAGAAVEQALEGLLPLLQEGDIVVDGGNSNYKDTVRRAGMAAQRGVQFVDAGTSGGIWGLRNGYCLMIGGAVQAVARLKPVFETLAPGMDRGWAHVGPSGAGHFVKMVHNGIEYGLMQAYAEGFALLQKKEEFSLDLEKIASLWGEGSVVRSWLLELIADALSENPRLDGIQPYVSDSGEGRWMVTEAIEQGVPLPVITLSLLERLRSRDRDAFSYKLLAMMRNKFGGHEVKREM